MKIGVAFIFLNFVNILFCQSIVNIEEIEGIWIAEDFYNSFEKTKNIHMSKNSFDPTAPVAIRISLNEIDKGKLNVGYAELHNHLLHPEVSNFIIVRKDTIHEQGHFEINLMKPDSLNYFRTSEIINFNYKWKSYLTWDENTVILYRPEKGDWKSSTIKYTRIVNKFDKNYQYPNPLYYYTRNEVLVGEYVLKEYNGTILSKSLKIKPNGLITGYPRFKNMYVYYSTDIYCGPRTNDQLVILLEDLRKENSKSIHFVMEKPDYKTIYLYETRPRYDYQLKRELGNPKYILEMK